MYGYNYVYICIYLSLSSSSRLLGRSRWAAASAAWAASARRRSSSGYARCPPGEIAKESLRKPKEKHGKSLGNP